MAGGAGRNGVASYDIEGVIEPVPGSIFADCIGTTKAVKGFKLPALVRLKATKSGEPVEGVLVQMQTTSYANGRTPIVMCGVRDFDGGAHNCRLRDLIILEHYE